MRVTHPRAGDGPGVAPAAVDVRGERRPVDDDGTFEGGDKTWLQQFARRYDVAPDDLVVEDTPTETCTATKNDGEVCGRELPCPYHSDGE